MRDASLAHSAGSAGRQAGSNLHRVSRDRSELQMNPPNPITLSRACEAIEIPSGIGNSISEAATVRIMKSMGAMDIMETKRSLLCCIDVSKAYALSCSLHWGYQ